jgi:inorganic pyrophosphatase
VDIVNPGDGELLDVIVADGRPRARGERLQVRVIDILDRSNDDHKLLGVPVDVPPFDRRVQARLKRARSDVLAWYAQRRTNVEGQWAGETRALDTIAACRNWTEAHE